MNRKQARAPQCSRSPGLPYQDARADNLDLAVAAIGPTAPTRRRPIAAAPRRPTAAPRRATAAAGIAAARVAASPTAIAGGALVARRTAVTRRTPATVARCGTIPTTAVTRRGRSAIPAAAITRRTLVAGGTAVAWRCRSTVPAAAVTWRTLITRSTAVTRRGRSAIPAAAITWRWSALIVGRAIAGCAVTPTAAIAAAGIIAVVRPCRAAFISRAAWINDRLSHIQLRAIIVALRSGVTASRRVCTRLRRKSLPPGTWLTLPAAL